MNSYQQHEQPDEESMLLSNTSASTSEQRKPITTVAVAAAVATTILLSLGAVYSSNSSSVAGSSTELAATFNFGNTKYGVMCGDSEASMRNGNDLYSESGQFRLAFQSDGNLVLYDNGNAFWSTNTYNNGDRVALGGDGHFLLTKGGSVRWVTNRYGYSKTFIIVQNDGNIVEYDYNNLQAVWASGTSRNGRKGNVDLNVAKRQCYTDAPTPAPIADPTEKPTALPTLKPSAQPTAGPTKWTTFFGGDRPLLKANSFRLNDYGENSITTMARGGGFSCKNQKSALAGIKLSNENGWSGSGQFFYNCAQAATKDEPWSYLGTTSGATGWNDNGGVIFLDRHSMSCPQGSYLTSLTPEKDGNRFRWNYECVQFASSYKQSDCVEQNTGYNDPGFGIFFLDRHLMQCDNSKAITSFRGETRNGWFRFSYNCCPGMVMYPSAAPTDKPISRPTLEPTALPTDKPTKEPIAEPSQKPIASPTFAPTDEPTKEPTNKPTREPSALPTEEPIAHPTLEPVAEPTLAPNRDKEIALENAIKRAAEEAAEKAASDLKEAADAAAARAKEEEDARAAAADAAAELAEAQRKEAEAVQAEKDARESADAAKAKEALEAQEDAKDAQKEAADTLADATKAAEDATESKNDALQDASAAQAAVDNAQLDILSVEILQAARKDSLACPFTFKQGVSKVIVPEGCSFFATNDVTWSKQKKLDAPAVYFCTKSAVPLEISSADLKKYGLASSVSFIQPSKGSKVQFWSADNFKGSTATFSSSNYMPLNSFKFHDGSSANDNVKSVILTTTAAMIPEECKDLTFSTSMKLNTKLMAKGGKFHSGKK